MVSKSWKYGKIGSNWEYYPPICDVLEDCPPRQNPSKWQYARPKWRDGGSLANTMVVCHLTKITGQTPEHCWLNSKLCRKSRWAHINVKLHFLFVCCCCCFFNSKGQVNSNRMSPTFVFVNCRLFINCGLGWVDLADENAKKWPPLRQYPNNKGTLIIFYGQRVLRHDKKSPDTRKKTCFFSFIFIFPSDMNLFLLFFFIFYLSLWDRLILIK